MNWIQSSYALTTRVSLSDLVKPVVILHHVSEVFEGHVHAQVCAKAPVLIDVVPGNALLYILQVKKLKLKFLQAKDLLSLFAIKEFIFSICTQIIYNYLTLIASNGTAHCGYPPKNIVFRPVSPKINWWFPSQKKKISLKKQSLHFANNINLSIYWLIYSYPCSGLCLPRLSLETLSFIFCSQKHTI